MSNMSNMSNMNNNFNLVIIPDFDKFKIGLIKRILNNYQETNERQQAIDMIPDITILQANNLNSFCKIVLPILWDAEQDEKDYCKDSQMVYVRILGGFNKELRVRSYYHGNTQGNPIKGRFLQSEFDKITSNNENIISIINLCLICI